MAHSPEYPELYVCTGCQTVSAGTVVSSTDGDHRYAAPDQCAACGGDAFAEIEQYPHRKQ